MAQVVATIKIMPESPDSDLTAIEQKAKEAITAFTGESEMKSETQPVAFGLKAIIITFVMEEEKGSTEDLEKDIAAIEQVNSVEVTDVRRAVG